MTEPAQEFFAIAACMLERGNAHSRYRAELVFCLADDADSALGALRKQVADKRPGWEIVSTAIRAVPRLAQPEAEAENPPCT